MGAVLELSVLVKREALYHHRLNSTTEREHTEFIAELKQVNP